MHVSGDVAFGAGSIYQVQVSAAGQTDAVVASGTATISGGTVDVIAGAGLYSQTTTYRILTATGGRTGEFGSLTTTSNLAFLTPHLTYDATGVDLAFARTTVPTPTPGVAPTPGVTPTPGTIVTFPSVAVAANERATATAIEALGAGQSLYDAVLSQSVAGARQAFAATSGEVHASAVTAAVKDTSMVRDTLLNRMFEAERIEGAGGAAPALDGFAPVPPDAVRGYAAVTKPEPAAPLPRFALWGRGFGDFGQSRSAGNAATLNRSLGGFMIGGDTRIDGTAFDNWRVGLVGGYTNDALSVRSRSSSGTTQSAFGGLYASGRYGALGIHLGATAGGLWTDTQRSVAFPGFIRQGINGYPTGDVVQGFGELGYKIGLARGFLEPVVAGAVHLDQGQVPRERRCGIARRVRTGLYDRDRHHGPPGRGDPFRQPARDPAGLSRLPACLRRRGTEGAARLRGRLLRLCSKRSAARPRRPGDRGRLRLSDRIALDRRAELFGPVWRARRTSALRDHAEYRF